MPPSASCTAWALCGRNGDSSVRQSLTACAATWSTVAKRSGSDVRSFHGAWSDRYLFASPTTRIASPTACFCRCVRSRSPTARKPASVVASSAWSASVEGARGRDRAEVLVDHRGDPVDEVAPAGDQLVVGPPDELRPGEVGVLVLGPGDRDEVPQRVGLVAGQHVAHVDDDAARGRELPALHRQELAAHDLGGQLQLAEHARARRRATPLPS